MTLRTATILFLSTAWAALWLAVYAWTYTDDFQRAIGSATPSMEGSNVRPE